MIPGPWMMTRFQADISQHCDTLLPLLSVTGAHLLIIIQYLHVTNHHLPSSMASTNFALKHRLSSLPASPVLRTQGGGSMPGTGRIRMRGRVTCPSGLRSLRPVKGHWKKQLVRALQALCRRLVTFPPAVMPAPSRVAKPAGFSKLGQTPSSETLTFLLKEIWNKFSSGTQAGHVSWSSIKGSTRPDDVGKTMDFLKLIEHEANFWLSSRKSVLMSVEKYVFCVL